MLSSIRKVIEAAGFIGIALFVVAAIVPIIVRWAATPIDPLLMPILRSPTFPDVFAYHKSWVLMACAVAILLYRIGDLIVTWPDFIDLKQKTIIIFKDPIVIILSIYLLFVFLSNVFSPYTNVAFWGIHDRREGLFVQFAYITVFFSTLFYVKGELQLRLLLAGLLFSSLIMGSIGFSQFINRDFFATQIASYIVNGWGSPPMTPGFQMAYGTNFNPNTFGLVTAMLFPTLFAAAIAWKNYVWRGLFLLAGTLMAIGVVASRSVGGIIGAATAVAVIVITLGG